jgi:hypothetical protein
MTLDSATLTRAKQALRADGATGQPATRDEAYSALSDLIVSADSNGGSAALALLGEAREMLSTSPAAANAADNLLDSLVR